MASVQLQGPFSVIAGRIGGTVFQRNPITSVIKNTPTARKPRAFIPISLAVPYSRGKFAYVARQWRSLSPTLQANWKTAALNFVRYNRFLIPYNPSGYQLFMELNSGLVFTNRDLITSAPSVSSFPAYTASFAWVAGTPAINFTQVIASGDTAYRLYIYATTFVSPGKTVAVKNFKGLTSVAMSTGTTVTNLYTSFTSQYGSIQTGMQAFFLVKAFNTHNGEFAAASTFSLNF
jgi:hypothetical protein